MDVGLTARGPFFGRRKGHKLRKRQAELFDTLLPRLAIDLSGPAPTELRTLSGAGHRDQLEIGFGGGESMIAQALARPGTGSWASSRSPTAWRRHRGDRTRIPADVPPALQGGRRPDRMASPDGSVGRVDLIHPDPWPKRRHWKRAASSRDATVTQLARILRRGGEYRFATDVADYAAWTLQRLLRSTASNWTAQSADDSRETLARLHDHALPRQGGTRGAPIVLPDWQDSDRKRI